MSKLQSFYTKAKFITSAPNIKALGADSGYEIAFAGRSNAGKSSAINVITNQKGLAKTSKTPGRTQLLNVFELDEERRLIDLPGYGYAKAPLKAIEKWQGAISDYLSKRESLVGLVILMDIRHPMKDLDQMMVQWAVDNNVSILILLTKADKLKRQQQQKSLQFVQEAALAFSGDVTIQLFSSSNRIGLDGCLQHLDHWLKRH